MVADHGCFFSDGGIFLYFACAIGGIVMLPVLRHTVAANEWYLKFVV